MVTLTSPSFPPSPRSRSDCSVPPELVPSFEPAAFVQKLWSFFQPSPLVPPPFSRCVVQLQSRQTCLSSPLYNLIFSSTNFSRALSSPLTNNPPPFSNPFDETRKKKDTYLVPDSCHTRQEGRVFSKALAFAFIRAWCSRTW